MTTGADRVMVDTNVLVHSTVDNSPHHQEARQWLAALHRQGVTLFITPQIAREYLAVLTRVDIFEQRFTPEEALNALQAMLPTLTWLEETEETVARLFALVRRYQVRGKQVHDANIVAVMLACGVTRLLTYNLDDFRRFEEIALEPLP